MLYKYIFICLLSYLWVATAVPAPTCLVSNLCPLLPESIVLTTVLPGSVVENSPLIWNKKIGKILLYV